MKQIICLLLKNVCLKFITCHIISGTPRGPRNKLIEIKSTDLWQRNKDNAMEKR